MRPTKINRKLVVLLLGLAAFAGAQERGRGSATDFVSEMFCVVSAMGRPTAGQPTGNPFSDKLILSIKVSAPESLLTKDQRVELADTIRDSVLVWRRACNTCPLGTLSMLRVDDAWYVNGALAGALRSADAETVWHTGPPSFDLGSPTGTLSAPVKSNGIDYDWLLLQMNSPVGFRMPPMGFERLGIEDPLVGRVCALDRSRLPDLIARVYDAIECGKTTPSKETFPLTLRLVDGPTSCGASPNIVACEADAHLVELNTRDFLYVAHQANSRAVFGHGVRRVDSLRVLAHELGHWIGLPHMNTPRNLMAQSVDKAECIDNAVVAAVSQAIRGSTHPNRWALYFNASSK